MLECEVQPNHMLELNELLTVHVDNSLDEDVHQEHDHLGKGHQRLRCPPDSHNNVQNAEHRVAAKAVKAKDSGDAP